LAVFGFGKKPVGGRGACKLIVPPSISVPAKRGIWSLLGTPRAFVDNNVLLCNIVVMKKKLLKMDGGLAVVIDLPLLAVIGAEDASEIELTTDGSRLILSPVRGGTGASAPTKVVSALPPPSSDRSLDRDDPKVSLRAIRELQEDFGFTAEHFHQLHHFGPKASLQAHINYCEGTGRFRSETNAVVNERLNHCLQLRRNGVAWDEAIESARATHPMPR